jgi:tetratricopeptide (TPR) repeat protein
LAIKVASVIGRHFTYEALHDNFPVEKDRSRLRDFLAAGLQSGLIEVDLPGPPVSYRFHHVVARDAAYNLLLFDQRQKLHRSIAQWYEATDQHRNESNFPLLAYHWERTGEVPKAIDYMEESGQGALRNGAYAEAADFFQRAIRLQPQSNATFDDHRRAVWHRQYGECQLGLGKLAASHQSLDAALALLQRPAPAGVAQLATSLAGQVLIQTFRRLSPRGLRRHRPLDRLVGTSRLEAARCYERLAEIFYLSNDSGRLVHAVISTLNLAERAGPSPELARAYANSCFAAGLAGLHPLARSYANDGRTTAQAVDDASAIAWVHEATGIYLLGMGSCTEAQQNFWPAIEICQRIGDWQHWGETMAASAQASYLGGDFVLGLQTWTKLFDKAKERGDDLQRAWGLNGRAEGTMRQGGEEHAEQAAEMLRESLDLLDQNVDRVSQFGAYGLMAMAQLRCGNHRAAHEAAAAGARLAQAIGAPTGYYTFNGYFGVARTYLALWEAEAEASESTYAEAARNACRALDRFARTFPIGRPAAALCRGHALWRRGARQRALRAWRKGLKAAEQVQLPYSLGLLHYELARHLPQVDTKRRNHAERARKIFEQLGADFDLRRVGQLPGNESS